jgi:hypothetical protein
MDNRIGQTGKVAGNRKDRQADSQKIRKQLKGKKDQAHPQHL